MGRDAALDDDLLWKSGNGIFQMQDVIRMSQIRYGLTSLCVASHRGGRIFEYQVGEPRMQSVKKVLSPQATVRAGNVERLQKQR